MCNDKKGLGAPPKPDKIKKEVCQRCLACTSCSATMSTKDKYSVSITDQQIEEYKNMFQLYDKDGDGTVSTKELGGVMRSIGVMMTEEELADMVEDADRE